MSTLVPALRTLRTLCLLALCVVVLASCANDSDDSDAESESDMPETPLTFTIGGAVTGLVSSGLVLQNNGGDDLAITADGTFTFATPLTAGSPYGVTVASDPMTPAQVCTVTNGSGLVPSQAVTDVAVTCTPPPSPPSPPPPPPTIQLALTTIATGLNSPVGMANAGDARLFVIEQAGRIIIVRTDGTIEPTPFLDIQDRVDDSAGEMGLLGLAFHPDYTTNGFFYVNYTASPSGSIQTRIARFRVNPLDPDRADPASEDILLTVAQPAGNHNAGALNFGPDGFLYIPLGDGGGTAGDANNNAQNLARLLGKIMRIDVDAGIGEPPDCMGAGSGNYTVPSANPFVDGPGQTCDEIWAVGLRNPWRSSFDRLTGDLYLGDVGERDREEVNLQPAISPGGENYGWRCYEGNLNFNLTGCAPRSTYTFPIFDYDNGFEGCSVIGGYVYRGQQFPDLTGRYVLTDFCSGSFWDLRPDGAGGHEVTKHTNLQVGTEYVAFGEDADGELYVVGLSGTIFRLETQ